MSTNIIVVLTALEVEFLAIISHLEEVTTQRHPNGTLYEVGRFLSAGSSRRVAVVQAGQGNVAAAIEGERAISHFDPSHVLFVGVAGGLKDVALGDVVAATKVYGYERGKAETEFLPRADFGESSYEMVQLAMKIARDRRWQVRAQRGNPAARAFVAPIAAGEKVVAGTLSPTFQFLRGQFSDAIAVEMEGLGILRASYANRSVQVIVVRGISDLIDGKSQADAGGSQELASAHAAAFALEMVAGLPGPGPASQNDVDLATEPERGESWWASMESVAIRLFPTGPEENAIWSRAGGDLSVLELGLIGRAAWYSALRKLRQGGGGSGISSRSLLRAMRQDFPNSSEIEALSLGL